MIMTLMHRALLTALFLICAAVSATAQQTDLLPAEDAFRLSVERSENGAVALRWEIAAGYYLYREHLEARDIETSAKLDLQTESGTVEDDANFGMSEVYYGQAMAHLEPQPSGAVAVTYQGCKKDSICYPPATQTIDMQSLRISDAVVGFGARSAAVAPAESTSSSSAFQLADDGAGGGLIASLLTSGGTLWVVASFLVFGILLAFTPCVLPMYPILSATLAREGEALTARRGFALSLTYVTAMATAFGLLGVAAAWSGQNLQILLQSPYAIGAIAVVFVALAASMFGLFELQLPSGWVNRLAGQKGGRRGSFGAAAAIGFTSALIVGPCVTAPLAAALLYIAQTGDVRLGAAALFALGLGQGIPLIAFGTLGGRALPRAGAWMAHVKHVFGFVFLAAALWMAGRILPAPFTLALWSILLLAAAVFAGLFDRLDSEASVAARFRKSAGLALSMAAALVAFGAASGGSDPLRPLAHLAAKANIEQNTDAAPFTEISAAGELHERLAAAGGRPTLVYFTADWCVTCKVVERDILPAMEVSSRLQAFQRIKVDLSTIDVEKQTLMTDLAVVGPPTMIFFDDAAEIGGSRIVGDVNAEKLLASISRAGR